MGGHHQDLRIFPRSLWDLGRVFSSAFGLFVASERTDQTLQPGSHVVPAQLPGALQGQCRSARPCVVFLGGVTRTSQEAESLLR